MLYGRGFDMDMRERATVTQYLTEERRRDALLLETAGQADDAVQAKRLGEARERLHATLQHMARVCRDAGPGGSMQSIAGRMDALAVLSAGNATVANILRDISRDNSTSRMGS